MVGHTSTLSQPIPVDTQTTWIKHTRVSHGHNAQIGSKSNAKCRTTAPEHLEIASACKTPTRKTLNRREAANGRVQSQQVRVRAFDLRIKHVFVPSRKATTSLQHGTTCPSTQRKTYDAYRTEHVASSQQRTRPSMSLLKLSDMLGRHTDIDANTFWDHCIRFKASFGPQNTPQSKT